MLLIINRLICFLLTTNLHPFHVSVCEVYYNENSHSLEISMKIFVDDLELSIRQGGHETFKLVDVEDPKLVGKEPIETYLKNNFQIKVNGKTTPLDFLGLEFDDDALLCYLEGKKIKKIETIEINNSIITEVYLDQINLTHFQYKGEMKSLKATWNKTTGRIDTSGW
ncbi:MAG: hypothetical protein MI975_10380 [Cytophagales bacterium]|nr:hypothetical protein [Cytophagales bacterium]